MLAFFKNIVSDKLDIQSVFSSSNVIPSIYKIQSYAALLMNH